MVSAVEILKEIRDTSSRTEKEAILKREYFNQTFVRILHMAYGPEYVYGLEKIDAVGEGVDTVDALDSPAFLTLARLADRMITGDHAREVVETYVRSLTPEDGELFKNIIAKDLKCGISSATINKAIPGTVRVFPYMRCSLPKDSNLSEFNWSAGVFSQVKADGMFANVSYSLNSIIEVTSRKGSRFATASLGKVFVDDIRNHLTAGYVYHGELLVQDGNGDILPREVGNGVLNSVLKGGDFAADQQVVFQVWDAIKFEEFQAKGQEKTPYHKRWERVNSLKSETINPVPTRIVRSMEEAMAHYRECTSQGLEGTILKAPDAIWKDGNSKDQVKLKVEAEVDLKVTGYNEGNGKHAGTFGSLICQTSDGEMEVSVSGFTDAMRATIWSNINEWTAGKIITVRANNIMRANENQPKHSLFLPRFVEERLDKTEADSFAQVEAIFQSAING